jgi:Histidine phosphotransferase C-terminal domain
LWLEATGEIASFELELHTALMLDTRVEALTSRTVHAYFTGLLVDAAGCHLAAVAETGRLRLNLVGHAA